MPENLVLTRYFACCVVSTGAITDDSSQTVPPGPLPNAALLVVKEDLRRGRARQQSHVPRATPRLHPSGDQECAVAQRLSTAAPLPPPTKPSPTELQGGRGVSRGTGVSASSVDGHVIHRRGYPCGRPDGGEGAEVHKVVHIGGKLRRHGADLHGRAHHARSPSSEPCARRGWRSRTSFT